MSGGSFEKGEATYNKLSPEQRGFFDAASARLSEAEVLFTADVIELAQSTGLEPSGTKGQALLGTKKGHTVLEYLNVVLAKESFGGGSLLSMRSTYFDVQFSPDMLRVTEAYENRHGQMHPSLRPLLEMTVDDWRRKVAERHKQYVASLVPEVPEGVTIDRVPIRHGSITLWARRTIEE